MAVFKRKGGKEGRKEGREEGRVGSISQHRILAEILDFRGKGGSGKVTVVEVGEGGSVREVGVWCGRALIFARL